MNFSHLRAHFKDLQRAVYAEFISDIQESVIHNSKRFWSFVCTLCYNDSECSTTDEFPDMSGRCFQTKYCTDSNFTNVPTCQMFFRSDTISNLHFTVDEVSKALKAVDCKKV